MGSLGNHLSFAICWRNPYNGCFPGSLQITHKRLYIMHNMSLIITNMNIGLHYEHCHKWWCKAAYNAKINALMLISVCCYRMSNTQSVFLRFLTHETFHISCLWMRSRGRLNIKMSSYQYRDPHVKYKKVLWPSYL